MSAVGATQPVGLGASDEALVAAARAGDDHAFGELYLRYGPRIVAYVLGMVGDHGRAEDITQEVFISALRRMRATDRSIAFKPWIYEIAKNACIDEFRRTRRTKEVPLSADEDDTEGQVRVTLSGGPTPDAALERRQQLDDLKGAFKGLSDNHHKVLVMRELEGLSYTEIGRRMGMTRPVVESTLFRARRRLGQEYEEIASGQRCEQVHAVIEAGGPRAVRALGVREHRRLARHVSHCQPCRRYAFASGVDEGVLKRPTVIQKVAALLPIPAFLRFRRHGRGDSDAASASATHPALASLQTASQTVAQLAGPGSPMSGLGRVAAAAAAVAVAGGGVAAGVATQSSSPAPHHRLVPSVASSGSQHSSSPGHQNRAARSTSGSGQATKAAIGVKATHTASTRAADRAAATGGVTATGQSVSHTRAGAADSGSSISARAANTKGGNSASALLSSAAGSLRSTKLPPLPKVTVPTLPSVDVGSLSPAVNSTISGAVGLVNGLLGNK